MTSTQKPVLYAYACIQTSMDQVSPKKNHGYISFVQEKTKLKIYFRLQNFEPKHIYAIHIHEFGDISDGCHSLGTHFNPTNKKHSHSEMGHAGDLINNFTTDASGKYFFDWETDLLSLNMSKNSCIIGRSIVVHKFFDDLGLKGCNINNKFKMYRDMSFQELKYIYSNLGYLSKGESVPNKSKMVEKLEKESITTGNASTRIAYGIIGISGKLHY